MCQKYESVSKDNRKVPGGLRTPPLSFYTLLSDAGAGTLPSLQAPLLTVFLLSSALVGTGGDRQAEGGQRELTSCFLLFLPTSAQLGGAPFSDD